MAGLLLVATGWGQVYGAPPSDVLVQVELIEVTHEKLTELLEDPVLVRDAKKLRVAAQELVRGKEAKIRHTMMVRTTTGGRGAVKSAREHIYPTEYEPPGLPSSVGSQAEAGLSVEPEQISPEQPDVPTAFETRYVGESLVAGARVDREWGTVELQLEISVVRKMGELDWGKRKTPGGNVFAASMPEFESLEADLVLVVPDGGFGFGGILRRESEPEKRIMVFVRCDVLEPGPEVEK